MTNFQLNKSGQENLMNPNHRIVPENVYWVTYEPDTKHEILHRKKVLQDGHGFIYQTSTLDSDEILKFTTALLTCIPLICAFKPRGEKSHCPLSKQI